MEVEWLPSSSFLHTLNAGCVLAVCFSWLSISPTVLGNQEDVSLQTDPNASAAGAGFR